MTMPVLTARQCPLCVLRFGSSSELEQHLRLDHPAAPEPAAPAALPARPVVAAASRPTGSTWSRRSAAKAFGAVAAIVLVASVSWHVAALASVVLTVALAVRTTANARGRRS